MKLFIFCLVFLACWSGLAQVSHDHIRQVADAALAASPAQKGLQPSKQEIDLKARITSSPSGYHVDYQASHKGLPIWGDFSQTVQLNSQLEVKDVHSKGLPTVFLPATLSEASANAQAIKALQRLNDDIAWENTGLQMGYHSYGQHANATYRLRFSADQDGTPLLYDVDIDGRSGATANIYSVYHHAARTEGRGTVYRHNPVAGSGLTKGQSSEAQTRALVSVPLRGLDGSGHLRGEYVDVTAPGLPATEYPRPYYEYTPGAARESSGQFHYAPTDPRFEEVMTYYWIDSAQRHLQQLGFAIYARPIPVDSHNFKGFNAYYDPQYQSIQFGDSSVQSAEDGSVVVHEYGHAILDDLVGRKFDTWEGSIFHEGFADYFSSVVARATEAEVGPDHFPEYLGEWFSFMDRADPPHLRSLVAPPFLYDPFLPFHEGGRCWSSAFYELDKAMPAHVFFKMLLEALYQTPSSLPEDIVNALLQVDADQHHGQYREQLIAVLRARGLYEPETVVTLHDLQPGENVFAPNEKGVSYMRLRVDASMERVKIGVGYDYDSSQFFMSQGELPTWSNSVGGNFFERTFDRETSYPMLQTGQDLVFFFRHRTQVTFTITVNEAPEVQVPDLPMGQTVDLVGVDWPGRLVGTRGKAHLKFDYSNLDNFAHSYLLISKEGLPNENAYIRDLVYKRLDPSGVVHFDLPASFQEKDTLFVAVVSYQSPEMPISLRWTSLPESIWTDISVETPYTGRFDSTGLARCRFELEPGAPAIIQSDAAAPFTLAFGERKYTSSFYQGVQTLFLHNSSLPGWSDLTVAYAFVPGQYECSLSGSPGASFSLSVNRQSWVEGAPLEDGQTNTLTLGANEVKVLQVNTPQDLHAMALRFQHNDPAATLHFQLLEKGQELPTFNSLGLIRPNDYTYISRDPKPPYFERAEFKGPYQLWLGNYGENPVSLEVNLAFSTEAVPAQVIEDGDVVTLDGALETYLGLGFDQEEYYAKPVQIAPPAGTQRVHLELELLQGEFLPHLLTGRDGFPSEAEATYSFSEYELGARPDQPFTLYFLYIREANPVQVKVHLTYDAQQPSEILFEESGRLPITFNTYEKTGQIKSGEPLRGFELAYEGRPFANAFFSWKDEQWPNFETSPSYLVPKGGHQVFSTTDQNPLRGNFWNLVFYNPRVIGDDEGTLSVKFHPFRTHTTVPPVPTAAAPSLTRRRLQVINPGQTPLSFTIDNQSQELPAGGFASVDLDAGDAVALDADRPLVLFEHLEGSGWTTLTAPSPYQDSNLVLPHLPPSNSPWVTQLALANGGTLEGKISGTNLVDQVIPPGLSELTLRGQAEQPSGLELKGGLDLGTTPFAETSLSGQQYWTLNNFYAAERAGLRPSQSLFLPHVPNLSNWWLGLALTNPPDWPIILTVSAYDANGKLLPTNGLRLEPRSTKIGLISELFPTLSATPAWMHLQSDYSEFMGIAFIGNKQDPTADVACYALPEQTAPAQALPGAISTDWYGLAVVNPNGALNRIQVEAVGGDGTVLATLERELGPLAKTLIVGHEAFPSLSGPYYLRVRSDLGRLLSLQLNGPALSLQGGVALP